MKKNLLERMQRSNEYNRPEYVDLYGNGSVTGYIKRGGKKYTRNQNAVADVAVEESKQEVHHANHLLSEEEKSLVRTINAGRLLEGIWLQNLMRSLSR
ncbi:coatomer subunit beta [Weissella oryzae SG25]|uniref:Coatomer subunit beta n=1 Tax=Weissella oryzae (strain DSM 25784 / JCM 18191 / LMG 30913 / SG25) TaxID=1329250 RepID=A0A069CW44_WEIOS|nr:hypothetical protein [Weissella oryzae]GAK32025.1 coatomer subunit beta [Weissella oryzae SG25]